MVVTKVITEEFWKTCQEPDTLIEYVTGKASDRRCQLYACYCSRRIWHLLSTPGRRLVEDYETMLIGLADDTWFDAKKLQDYRDHLQGLESVHSEYDSGWGVYRMMSGEAWHAPWVINYSVQQALRGVLNDPVIEARRQITLVREIFGNPFRPIIMETRWITPTVKGLADSIHQNNDFAGLPILADALEDAACADPEILGHLRTPGLHLRGCWALDKVLEKD